MKTMNEKTARKVSEDAKRYSFDTARALHARILLECNRRAYSKPERLLLRKCAEQLRENIDALEETGHIEKVARSNALGVYLCAYAEHNRQNPAHALLYVCGCLLRGQAGI